MNRNELNAVIQKLPSPTKQIDFTYKMHICAQICRMQNNGMYILHSRSPQIVLANAMIDCAMLDQAGS